MAGSPDSVVFVKHVRVCLITVFFFLIFYFQKQFSIFETKKLVW